MATAAEMKSKQRRIVLVGITGDGKSATGNTILEDDKAFASKSGFTAGTQVCCRKQSKRHNDDVWYDVMDTPGLFDADVPFAKRALEILRVSEEFEEPHAFLLVLRGDKRYKGDDNKVLDVLEIIFGQDVFKHTIVVFTHGSEYEDEDALLEATKQSQAVSDVVRKCGNRIALVENSGNSPQRKLLRNDLLKKIEDLSRHGASTYRCDEVSIHRKVLENHAREYVSTGGTENEYRDIIKEIMDEYKNRRWKRDAIITAASVGGTVAVGVVLAAYVGPAEAATIGSAVVKTLIMKPLM